LAEAAEIIESSPPETSTTAMGAEDVMMGPIATPIGARLQWCVGAELGSCKKGRDRKISPAKDLTGHAEDPGEGEFRY
jgi:hypothetical protein